MGIKSKKTGGLSKKRDFIEIILELKGSSFLSDNATLDTVNIYSNYCDLKRVSEYRIAQYGFEASTSVYDIFINPTAITIDGKYYSLNVNKDAMKSGKGDYNDGYNDDFNKSIIQEAVNAHNIHIIYKGQKLKVHFVQDIDDNLGQKLRIVAYNAK